MTPEQIAWDRSLCPACHCPDHDPGSCPNCPRCELHTDEAFDWVLRVEPELVAAHIDTLTAAVDEPHHLGFPVSGKTGPYDRTAVIVKREWYERVLAILNGETP